MKLLTILISRDLDIEVEDIISEMNIDCYVKITEAYGISHRCEGTIGKNMPWDASVLMIAGERDKLEKLAENIQDKIMSRPYKPCLRMMLQPVDKIWQ
ncbi:MAG: hypothetical protein U9N45_01470 [Gemmatimonadota bacterium]|nr:hypothetical protein [Gemmatimonadota bacterium]